MGLFVVIVNIVTAFSLASKVKAGGMLARSGHLAGNPVLNTSQTAVSPPVQTSFKANQTQKGGKWF